VIGGKDPKVIDLPDITFTSLLIKDH
jgi:hypothetical protein